MKNGFLNFKLDRYQEREYYLQVITDKNSQDLPRLPMRHEIFDDGWAVETGYREVGAISYIVVVEAHFK